MSLQTEQRERRLRARRSFRGQLRRYGRLILRPLDLVFDFIVALITKALVRGLRRVDPDRSSNIAGMLARRVGPLMPVNRVGRANLRAAFPEKSDTEIEAILLGVWDNLGRVAGEFIHLGSMWDFDPERPNARRIETQHIDRFIQLFADNKPALLFSAHLANWELAAICAAKYGLDSAVLFRVPNNRFVADLIHETRQGSMSELVPTGPTAVFAMASVIERGGHLGMLVDQHRDPGAPVNFFGRKCLANRAITRLARRFDCPVHGVRVIRLPGNRFRLELTEHIELPRDAEGLIDIDAGMQTITSIVEEWIREYPDQWLWLHRRWR